MFMRCSEGVFFFESDEKSMFEHTLSHFENLAMCSHDVRYALAMRAMCGLCVGAWALCGRVARYARAPCVGRTGYVCYVDGHVALSEGKTPKNPSCVGALHTPLCA